MKFKNLRTIVAVCVFVVLAAGVIFGYTAGSFCGVGIGNITALCPLGALFSMISAKTFIPRVAISLVVGVVLILLLGRAFCGWVCPVSWLGRVKNFFRPARARKADAAQVDAHNKKIAAAEIARMKHACGACGACDACGSADPVAVSTASKNAEGVTGGNDNDCASDTFDTLGGEIVRPKRAKLDSRHAVLGGSILTAAIFGFPVFCLICPVGLTIATVAMLVALFGAGDLSWAVLLFPALLVVELVFLRKWCSRLCPISAFLNLFGRFSKTVLPEIDNAKCIETTTGAACSKCATVCKYDINLRHPDFGELPTCDCARCMECVDVCPADAISVKALVKGNK